jgi:excisionase family DNA binding protein
MKGEAYLDEKLMGIKDLKKHLAIGNDKVYNMVRSRDFPAFRIGNEWKVIPSELKKWELRQSRKKWYS